MNSEASLSINLFNNLCSTSAGEFLGCRYHLTSACKAKFSGVFYFSEVLRCIYFILRCILFGGSSSAALIHLSLIMIFLLFQQIHSESIADILAACALARLSFETKLVKCNFQVSATGSSLS